MDAAGKGEACYTGMTMLAFYSVKFLQCFNIDTLAPFNGIESHLKGLLQCQFYFENLLDPKSEERQLLGFMLTRFTGPARWWSKLLVKGTLVKEAQQSLCASGE